MNPSDFAATIDSLPKGAVFHRCALQVNPADYQEKFRGRAGGKDPRAHAEAVVERALELEISVLAITDHNDASCVPYFRQAARNSAVTIFPGFELASSEGVHVLCIYPEETSEDRLVRYLGGFGITTPESSSALSKCSFSEILERVPTQQGVAIAAHATNNKGLFRVLGGEARIQAWRNKHLHAVQIPGSIEDLPQDIRGMVTEKNSDYRRSPIAGGDLTMPVAMINAGDIVDAAHLEEPSATCQIKMSEVSVEGLRQAFLDPGSRIQLNSRESLPSHGELLAISWEGGFLNGTVFRFNPNLNILVGGRGAGKSTVIESLRYVLNLAPIGEEARKAHDGIVRQVLKNGTKIMVQIRSCRPTEQVYVIERTVPNPPIIRSESGEISNLSVQEIFPNLEVYGQHEIAELTGSPEKLTALLRRFAESDVELEREKRDLQRELQKTRQSLLTVKGELQQVNERLATLPALEETLVRFRETGLESKLRLQSLLVREERLLGEVPERWETFAECLAAIRQELPIDRTFVSERALRDMPNRKLFAEVSDILEKMERGAEEAAKRLATAIKQVEGSFDSIRVMWRKRRDEAQTEYQRILRELQKSSIDGEEFLQLQREIEALRPMGERRTRLQLAKAECLQRRQILLAEWEDVKARKFRLLDQAAKKISKQLDSLVKVQITAAGDRGPLEDFLRDKVGGRLSEAIELLTKAPELSLPEFVATCRAGAEALQVAYAIPPSQAVRLAGASEEALLLAEELELPPTTEIRLNLAPLGAAPVWRTLGELSTGQKATAVLLLLLLESDAPLIVDQPEDDLDNRFIMSAVVPRIRREKWLRQFVFSTHNANIPVLGDAEMVLGLSDAEEAGDSGAQVAPEHMGAIDVSSVRKLIEEVLEGGKEAFENRRRKYGY